MNILIVDDEEIIVKWLKKNITELSDDYKVVETCINGKIALNYLLNNDIDILFTDIRMPVMDGMELLKKLNDNNIHPYIIMLSAYDDFSYVRDAFKLGASEFLLKPEITIKGLNDCINLAKERLADKSNEKKLDKIKISELDISLERFYSNPESLKINDMALCTNCDIYSKNQFFMICINKLSQDYSTDKIEEIIAFNFDEEKLNYNFYKKNDNTYFVLSEATSLDIEKFANELYKSLSTFSLSEISLSVSDVEDCSGDLLNLYNKVCEVSEYSIFYGFSGVSCYSSYKEAHESKNFKNNQMFELMNTLEKEHSWGELTEKLSDFWNTVEKEKPTLSLLRRFLLNFLFNIYWTDVKEEFREDMTTQKLFDICNTKKLESLRNQYDKQIESFIKILNEDNKIEELSESVLQVEKYINQNYGSAISLDDLANYVHLNRSYLSSLFKKETSVNINEYLQNVRIEKAKEMLTSHKLSIQEISYRIGIDDSAYFSKLFKKKVGVSPMDFRKITKQSTNMNE